MPAFVENLNGLELLFVCCAIFGATLFVIRLILMFIGHAGDIGADGHMDAGMMPDADAGDVDGGHAVAGHDSDISFKLLSLQGITAFFMMFGLIGWAILRQGNYPPAVPIAGGTVAGLATVWVMKKIFQMASGLQSSGTLNLQNAIGQEGTVYLTIRPGQTGKVQVAVQERLSVLDAVTEDDQEIKTGQVIRVVKVSAGKLVVEKK